MIDRRALSDVFQPAALNEIASALETLRMAGLFGGEQARRALARHIESEARAMLVDLPPLRCAAPAAEEPDADRPPHFNSGLVEPETLITPAGRVFTKIPSSKTSWRYASGTIYAQINSVLNTVNGGREWQGTIRHPAANGVRRIPLSATARDAILSVADSHLAAVEGKEPAEGAAAPSAETAS